jgi:release factor glutamine methyltransferase
MTKQPTVRDILQKTEAYLRDRSADSPRLSAQLVLAKGLGLDRMKLFLEMDRPLTANELDAVRPLVARRGRGEPVAYITGEREFYSLSFEVAPGVLIPRPETELVIEQAKLRFAPDQTLRFADLGTGSGCLAVTLAVAFPASSGVALDLSPEALAVAARNVARHGASGRVELKEGRFEDLPAVQDGYHLVVSNPPYVSEAEYGELPREVAAFEPRGALTPGVTGLEAYPAVIAAAARTLAPGGWLMMEIGWKQGAAVRELVEVSPAGFEGISVVRDLAGLDRVVAGKMPG